MIEVLIGVIALAGLGLSLALAMKVQRLETRLQASELPRPAPHVATLPEPERNQPLEGLRIALAIEQDHSHPVFANLLKEQLLIEDVGLVTLLAAAAEADWSGTDILIAGKLVCNGYAEIYYEADFACSSPVEPICAVIERPPHGDRPSNLAIELVTKLKSELVKLESRNERRRALRELHE